MTTGIALAVYALSLLAGAIVVWRRPVAAVYLWIVGVAVHNAVGAALYGAGVRGSALTAIQAWKEILLAVALARVVLDAARSRSLPFRPGAIDALALAYGALVCVYALIPQNVLGGSADRHAVGLALKHDLIPVAAYFVGRSLVVRREELGRLAWTIVGAAAVVAALGLIDVYAISISWWRNSAVVPYFDKHLGYDYHGTGRLPENFIYNVGGDKPFLRRLVSLFLSPLATAYMLTVALLLAVALRRRARLLAALCAVVAAGLLFTFSRSSLVALAVGLVVFAYAQRRWWPVGAAIVTIGVSVAWVHVFPHIAPTGRFTKADLAYQHQQAKTHPGGTGNPISPNDGRPPPAGLRAGERGPDRVAHRDTDQGGRIELHRDGRGDGHPRVSPLDGLGRRAPRRARAGRAADALVDCGRRCGCVRRRVGARRPDRRDRRPVDGLRALVARRARADHERRARPVGRTVYRCR
ncbi:MAG: hypothetical protein E6G50_03250 [Actinobacteria bacterium]|nr:MAG: hypothetical protein E6G50_03250 [Actinomycetota bacterium]